MGNNDSLIMTKRYSCRFFVLVKTVPPFYKCMQSLIDQRRVGAALKQCHSAIILNPYPEDTAVLPSYYSNHIPEDRVGSGNSPVD